MEKYKKYKPILAVGDAGLIPYYSGMETIDYVGLANTEIAHAIKEKREPKIPAPDIFIVYSHEEYGCIPAEFDHAKLGVTALIKAISDNDYACIAGPDAVGSFYLNILVKRNFYASSNLIEDIADVKKKSNVKIRARDAMFFPGLR